MKNIIKNLSILLILVSFATAGMAGSNPDQPKRQLKVAAYNVEFSKSATAQEIGNFLRSYNFDVVCFSEAPGGEWTKNVARALGLKHYVTGRYSTAGHKDKYKAIVSKTPLYGYEEVLMADTLHTATKARTKIDGKEVTLYSVHFPFGWRDQAHIDETTGKIKAFEEHLTENRTKEAYSLVMGDFNFIVSRQDTVSAYYELLKKSGYEVTWKGLNIPIDNKGTMVKFVAKGDNGRVIDHIMYRPEMMKALQGEILEMERPLSDHKPVWALFEFIK